MDRIQNVSPFSFLRFFLLGTKKELDKDATPMNEEIDRYILVFVRAIFVKTERFFSDFFLSTGK